MVNKSLKFLIFVLVIFLKQSDAQQWVKYYGGNLEDKAYAVTIDHAGYVYITGYSTITGHGADITTVKINPSTGSQIWKKYYNGPASQDDKAYAITVDRLNNVYVAGFTTGIGTGTDMTVIKYSSSGSQLWDRSYNSTTNGDDGAYGIAVDDSLNVYVTGFVTLAGTDMYLAKYNSGGVYQWGRFYGGSKHEDDKAYAITIDDLDNIYIGGYSNNNGTGADFTVIKYNSATGDSLWVGKYDGPEHMDDIAVCMALSDSNHIYLSGSTKTDTSAGSEDFLTVRFNTDNGDTVWSKTYGGSGAGSDKVYAITVDDLDNVYITGSAMIQNNADYDHMTSSNFMTMKYSSAGDSLWAASYDTSGNNEVSNALCLSSTGEFLFVTGSTLKGNDPDSQNIATVKYNALTGEQLQASVINGAGKGEDNAYSIVLDSTDNVFLAGYMKNVSSDLDMIGAKYQRGDLIEVRNISTSVPSNFSLYQNYPNPFNPSTTIKFDIIKQSPVKIVIYDILGRQVDMPVNKNLRAGSYEVNYSASKLSSGVYFYEMTADGYRSVKKMILIK